MLHSDLCKGLSKYLLATNFFSNSTILIPKLKNFIVGMRIDGTNFLHKRIWRKGM